MAPPMLEKRGCSKCEKGAGILTCNGCRQCFCRKHSEEHRVELAAQMDSIAQDHDRFRRDIDVENDSDAFRARIDAWERESINRITQAAETARNDLRSVTTDPAKQALKPNMDEMSKEIQSSRESEAYTEEDLTKWIHQLNRYRQDLQKLARFSLVDNDNASSIVRLIKVRKTECDRSSNQACTQTVTPQERCTLSDDGLVAFASGLQLGEYAAFMDTCRYSIGTLYVRVRIEKLTGGTLFFGILPFSHTDPMSIFTSRSRVYGWCAGHVPVVNNSFDKENILQYLCNYDEITLILSCQSREISFRHHRTERNLQLAVDPRQCPLPWKIVVVLYHNGDRVRILQ